MSGTRGSLGKKIPKTRPALHTGSQTWTDLKADRLLDQVSASHSHQPWKQNSEGTRTDDIPCHSVRQNKSPLSQQARAGGTRPAQCCGERKGQADPLGSQETFPQGNGSAVWCWERWSRSCRETQGNDRNHWLPREGTADCSPPQAACCRG